MSHLMHPNPLHLGRCLLGEAVSCLETAGGARCSPSRRPALHGSHSTVIYPQFCKRWRARRPLHWYRQHVKSWLMDHIFQRFCETPTAAARGPSSFSSSVNSMTSLLQNVRLELKMREIGIENCSSWMKFCF